MAGTSIGMNNCMLVGLRVSVAPTYIPGYEKNGQTINPCLKVRAFINRKNDRSDVYDLRLWGKLADIGAKSLSIGKEFHARVRIESFEGRVWRDKGKELVLNSDGTPVTVTKTAFVVEDIVFGAESEKHINAEITAGKRPANYNDGKEGSALWKSILQKRVGYAYNGAGKTFGYAQVRKNGETFVPAASLQNQVATAADNPALQDAFGGVKSMTANNEDPF